MRIRSRWLNQLVIWIGVRIVRLLFATCRKQIRTDVPNVSPYEQIADKRYLYCVWHDQIVMIIFSGRPQQMSGLVSRHHDGGYVADVMQASGIQPVRGSTRRGGAQAMRRLISAAGDLHVTITPDGPRGPRHRLKSGIVFLASHSGRAIIPVALACRRCWKIKGNWTDMMIPKPFTTIVARGGSPIFVPPNINREELERYSAIIEAEMERLAIKVDCQAQGETPPTIETKVAA